MRQAENYCAKFYNQIRHKFNRKAFQLARQLAMPDKNYTKEYTASLISCYIKLREEGWKFCATLFLNSVISKTNQFWIFGALWSRYTYIHDTETETDFNME